MKKNFLFLIAISFGVSSCNTDYLEADSGGRLPLAAKVRFVNARPVNANLHFWTYITQVTTTPVRPNQSTAYLDVQFGDVQINFTENPNTTFKASQ
jgi:hypothetical protein